NTMLMGEYLRSRGDSRDQRGLLWYDEPGYGHLYTTLNPNTASPDITYSGWCVNLPQLGLPCISGNTYPNNNNTAGARSRHPGGVSALFGDGSVRFVQQDINNSLWQALGTIAGGEVLGTF